MLNPSRYRILAIGKTRKQWIKEGVQTYLKRLPGLKITELRDSNSEKESKAICSEKKSDEILIALTEEGDLMSSIVFTKYLENIGSQKIAFAIGGANGLTAHLKGSAQLQLSLSTLTFPHEIARLLLLEQLYRASTISQGGPYHRA